MKTVTKYFMIAGTMLALNSACSLEEYNPSGLTVDMVLETYDGYNKLINNCYFDIPRYFYGRSLLLVTEAGTDIWTADQNSTNNQQYFKYASGGAMPVDMAKDFWNGAYDGINSCNACIDRIDKVKGFPSEAAKKEKVAEAHFLRALYYYHLVEQFGKVVFHVHETTGTITSPERVEPMKVYEEVIIPDLEFAIEHLPVTRDANNLGRPTKKAALGLLAKACLQTKAYGTDAYLAKALEASKKLIDDVAAGGAQFDAKMSPNYADAFPWSTKTNDEILHLVTYSQNYGSTNVYDHNNDYKRFYCYPDAFGAILADATEKRKMGRWSGGNFMPSRYLLDLFVMPDGTVDPRFYKSFQTEWAANKAYTWTADALIQYDRASDVNTQTDVAVNETAIKFVLQNEAEYAEKANKLKKPFMWVDVNDVYDAKSVKMKYTRVNQNPGEVENPFIKFYPSLTKYNSINAFHYQTTNTSRFTTDMSSVVMRMGEIYLIAAEAEFYLRGANADAANYINVLRSRAYGAGKGQVTAANINVQFILDERARELCGEYTRWYDLKRAGKLNKAYLMEKNPDVGQYFIDGVHHVRPIPQAQIDAITNKEGFQNNGY
jgi:hypothetical protein